jgi:serine/threonine protein kinase
MTEFTVKPEIEIPVSPHYSFTGEVVKDWKRLSSPDGSHTISLNEIIGIGGQGVVYSADSNLYGSVVVKEIHFSTDTEITKIASDIKVGPTLYEVIYEGNKTFLVLERLIFFRTGRSVISEDTYIYQLCGLVTLLLENGIFHNDLRDTNIMFSKSGFGDYGSLRIIDYESAVRAFTIEEDSSISPLIDDRDFEGYMYSTYSIIANGVKYDIEFPLYLQVRHHQIRISFKRSLYQNGYD